MTIKVIFSAPPPSPPPPIFFGYNGLIFMTLGEDLLFVFFLSTLSILKYVFFLDYRRLYTGRNGPLELDCKLRLSQKLYTFLKC